eukprot:SAG25_NODE_513_length_7280_cov_53.762707_4_plen_76_part_00
MRPQGRVGVGGLQERARRCGAASRWRARAAAVIDNPVPVKMGAQTVVQTLELLAALKLRTDNGLARRCLGTAPPS